MHTLMLIDDHHIVREGFKRLFDGSENFKIVGEAATPDEALDVCCHVQPDLVMLDLSLGELKSGLDLLPRIREITPDARVAIVSMHDDPALVVRAFDCGASAFISKGESPEHLETLLLRVMDGEQVTSNNLRPAMVKQRIELSNRERDIVRGIVAGVPPKVIAYDLGVSDKTLYRHRANLMEKLGAKTANDVMRMAREHGWLVG